MSERLPVTRRLEWRADARARAGRRRVEATERAPAAHRNGHRPTVPVAEPSEGTVLGRYRLERRLGAGGFGVVWLAWDERLHREVAIKVLPREGDGETATRGEREARAAARLNHPGVVALYELSSDERSVYLVSELVRGRTFADLIGAGPLSDRDVGRVGAAVAAGLAHAHERGVVHRDVKPQNVLVPTDAAAAAGWAKLADFGVATLAGSERISRSGDVAGTLAYMAPEQADGAPPSPAADVYSLALSLYEAWTGANPVRGATPAATARRIGRPIRPLAARRAELPRELCRMVDAALDSRPERRPRPAELGAVLAASSDRLSDEDGAGRPPPVERLRAALRPASARVVAALAAGTGTAFAVAGLVPAPPVEPLAGGALVAALVALLPRAGWWLAGAALVASLATEASGSALVLAVPILFTPLLLAGASPAWPLPLLAPALGAVGLGPLFLAAAGLANRWTRRAGIAAAGFLWLLVLEAWSGERLLLGPAPTVTARSAWEGSAYEATLHVLVPTLDSPLAAGLLVWAALAVTLPLAVRGVALWADVAGGALWGAAAVAAQEAVARLAPGEAAPRGLVAGALLGALAAVAARARGRRDPSAKRWGAAFRRPGGEETFRRMAAR